MIENYRPWKWKGQRMDSHEYKPKPRKITSRGIRESSMEMMDRR